MRHTLRFLGLVSLVALFCWGTAAFAGAVTSKEEIKISTTGGGIKIKSNNGNSFAIGGRIMYDYDSFDGMWNYADSGDDDTASESEFRRTRVTLKGSSGKSWAYKMTIDIDEGEAEVDTGYIAYKGLGLGNLMVGRFKAPFGLEELTSSKWISTIERSPTPELGFLSGKPSFQAALHGHGGPLFWQLAVIDEDQEDDDGSDAYSMAARVGAHMPIGEGSFMHLAGSFASRDFGDDATQRFRTRLAVHTVGSRPIDFKDVGVDDADQFGLEGAVVMGPLSLQGEYRQADFDAGDAGAPSDVDVEGSYIQASYILTGESRGYEGKAGKFDGLKPKGPMGAWELVAKYEDGELDIKTEVEETEFELLTLGLNWYANKNVKFMLNYLDADTDHANNAGSEKDGQAMSFRAQYAF